MFYFLKFVTKNRAFGNNTIFLQQFFGFGGGFPPSACLRPWLCYHRVENGSARESNNNQIGGLLPRKGTKSFLVIIKTLQIKLFYYHG